MSLQYETILFEAIERWNDPQPVRVGIMASVAAVGLLGNLVGLWMLGHHHGNLNMRGAFLHVVGDTLTSVGVLVGSGIIALTGWSRVDPIISMGIAVVIVFTSLNLLREVVEVLLEAAPRSIDTDAVRASLSTIEGVEGVHDLHVWTVSPGYVALSAHVVLADQALSQARGVMDGLKQVLADEFDIEHTTIQFECESCTQEAVVCVNGGHRSPSCPAVTR